VNLENLCIVGLQWGDEGKGKVVDYLADGFDSVVRFNGGSNAGHTVVVDGSKHVFHLLPSAALKSKNLLIAAGVAVDPDVLSEELSLVKRYRTRTVVDFRATVVSPLDKMMDVMVEELRGSSAIGTTRRGVGPAYALRAFRLSPRVADIITDSLDMASMRNFYSKFLSKVPDMEDWRRKSRILLKKIAGNVSDVINEINEKGGAVLFEGSQGTLLDLLYGTYPFVTASGTLSNYVPESIGVPPNRVGDVMGVAKCYTTRVGSGPFPTETDKEDAAKIRNEGNEYGSTTGRPRRIGWLDMVSLKYAVKINGVKKVSLTKLDVLSKLKRFKICEAYSVDGEETEDFARCLPKIDEVRPVYSDGWTIRGEFDRNRMGGSVQRLIDYIEERLRVDVKLVSWGEDRSMTYER
jgi:adenylosuccinate synthase